MPPAVFCSIATRSHSGAALTCLRSVQEAQPQAELALLAIDEIPAPAGWRVLRPQDCIPERTLRFMRQRYSGAELCFAAKPFLIARLLEEGAGQVHYLDGDCLAFASLESLLADLAGADVLLTPHCLTPVPDDGSLPPPLTLMRSGVFNAGYLGVRNTAEGRRFAAWFASMTAHYAYNAPDRGMCGDQRWLDLVPVLFPGAAICRRAGANVGYWNLHERALTRDAQGVFQVNDEPLLFFHFSGWRSEQAELLSIHRNRHQPVAEDSVLAELLREYQRRLPAVPPRRRSWRRLWRA